jgi:hypothetical protein
MIRSGLTPSQTITANHAPSGQLTESVAQTAQPSMPTDSRSRLWERLASSATLPVGQLTAIGWSERPERVGSGQSAMGSDDPPEDSPARRPSTYLELMRSQNKG